MPIIGHKAGIIKCGPSGLLLLLHPVHGLTLWSPWPAPYARLRRRRKLMLVTHGFIWHACPNWKWTAEHCVLFLGCTWKQWWEETLSRERTLCRKFGCLFHGHEHPWNITVKLDRVSMERSFSSLIRNGGRMVRCFCITWIVIIGVLNRRDIKN